MTLPNDITERKWVNGETLLLFVFLSTHMEANRYETTIPRLAKRLLWDEEKTSRTLEDLEEFGIVDVSRGDMLEIFINKLKRSTRGERKVKVVNNIEERKVAFGMTLQAFEKTYGRAMLLDFYHYWTEPNKSNTKMRFELQRTWSLEGRLRTWSNNNYGNKQTANCRGAREVENRIGGVKGIITKLIGG